MGDRIQNIKYMERAWWWCLYRIISSMWIPCRIIKPPTQWLGQQGLISVLRFLFMAWPLDASLCRCEIKMILSSGLGLTEPEQPDV